MTAAKQVDFFSSIFDELKDPRRLKNGNIRHSLNEILFLCISGAISGFAEWDEIEEFGKYKIKWLRRFYPYKWGIPSHDTLSRLFARLDPEMFGKCFVEWTSQLRKKIDNEVIAIDGKCIRGTSPHTKGMDCIYYVSAFAAKNNLVLGQVATKKKSNEIKAIPKLLDLIDCKGTIITADALNCQTKIAEKVIEKQADYLLALKKNQGDIFDQVVSRFERQAIDNVNVSRENDHGRLEKRTCSVISDLRFVDNAIDWKGLQSIVKIESERIIKNTEVVQTETRYYLSSLKPDAALINESTRSHWSVENNLHWHLDVTFREDTSRKRKDNSPENFSIILKTALNLLAKNKGNKSVKRRRFQALMVDSLREELIFGF